MSTNWSFQKSKMPGISAKLEMVLSNDSTKLEPFWYGKKMVQGLRKSAISAPPWQPAPNRIYFKRPAPFFLHYENGSNLVESLLSIIPIYAEFPGIFDFWKDQLMLTLYFSILSPVPFKILCFWSKPLLKYRRWLK